MDPTQNSFGMCGSEFTVIPEATAPEETSWTFSNSRHPRYVDLDDTRHEEPLPSVGVSGQVGSSRFSGSDGGVSPTYLSLSKMSYVFTYQPRLLYTVIMTDI